MWYDAQHGIQHVSLSLATSAHVFDSVDRFPAVLQHMKQILRDINNTAIPPGNLPWDPKADPQLWDHTWTNFGDYEKTV